MQFKHAPAAVSAVFDDPNLVSAAGLVPMLRFAQRAGLAQLAQDRLGVPTDKGSNAGAKVCALVAGMLAGLAKPRGTVIVKYGKKKIKVKLVAKRNGKVVVRLPKLAQGKYKVTVTYKPNAKSKKFVTKAKSKKVTLRVK